jgi:deoxyribodipyrimidine photo-lyase
LTVPGVVWFRRDLRLTDNPAWADATERHNEVVALFVLDPALLRPGSRRTDLLLHHLHALDGELRELGGRLHVRSGAPVEVVPQVVEAVGATAVHWNRDVTPYSRTRDTAVRSALTVHDRTWWGSHVRPPGSVLTGSGTPYKVFTPFHRSWSATPIPEAPKGGDADVRDDAGDGLPDATTSSPMPAGEQAALDRLEDYARRAPSYADDRDDPGLDATSRLSADLKFGTLSPTRVVERLDGVSDAFVRQVAWRDFYAHVLHAFPHSFDAPLDPRYEGIAWDDDEEAFDAWKQGRTGFPIVDAGMRQLEAEGWMHGRVRMIAASFLVKDLLIDWRRGERWFRERLLDGDVAQNIGNWQWVAGTGADAAPYFRVFNPTLQGKKFDPDGTYVRRWVSELGDVPPSQVHQPWKAGMLAGDYPAPIVDHAAARDRTIAAYKAALEANRG